VTTVIGSGVDGRQIEPTEPVGIGQDVQLDDYAAAIVKPITESRRAPRPSSAIRAGCLDTTDIIVLTDETSLM
jgi:hypothetical protein